MKRTIKKIIKWMIFAGLIFGGWQANIRWEEFKPVLAELEEKDSEKYAKMVEEAKSFHIKEAEFLYREIKSMTREAVITLRYEKWREKRKADKKFHEKYYDDELLNRIKVRKSFKENYQSRMDEIRELTQRQPVKVRFDQWKKTEPWKQRLILHEKCVKYIKMEMKDREVFRQEMEVSKVSTLVVQLSNESLPVELLCNNLVPSAKSAKETQEAVLRLKENLNFKYYIRLLEEIGIPRQEIFPLKDELISKVRDYNDF
ncbi:MAG: hypothetical protein ISR86_08890 [Nitrospinaceae bacterium]|nr:hypothetical protein [Nitrospinaceae bacterium]